jgi:hypothetical protein
VGVNDALTAGSGFRRFSIKAYAAREAFVTMLV